MPGRFLGSEIELMEFGLIKVVAFDGLKARLLLTLCLARAIPPEGIIAAFARAARATRPLTHRPASHRLNGRAQEEIRASARTGGCPAAPGPRQGCFHGGRQSGRGRCALS